MFQILNFDNWSVYDGYAEGSGRGKKTWLINKETGQIGLFKYPKVHSDGETLTTEYISEHLAYQIGKLINIETAVIDIGYYNNDLGCISYDIIKNHNKYVLFDGASMLTQTFLSYDREGFIDSDSGKYYNLNQIIRSSPLTDNFPIYKMLIFDFIIGNSDRHHYNYAFIRNVDTNDYTFSPLYDNGSPLCCRITENESVQYFGKDKIKNASLIDSKSKSFIGIDGSKKYCTQRHSDIIRNIINRDERIRSLLYNIISILNDHQINSLINEYPDIILSANQKRLISIFLCGKVKLLSTIMEE